MIDLRNIDNLRRYEAELNRHIETKILDVIQSKYQLFWLLFSMEIGMTYLLTFVPTFKEASQGAPLAMILAVWRLC